MMLKFQGPEVEIDEPDIDFGLVRFGTTATARMTVHNDSQVPARYQLKEKLPANQADVSYQGSISGSLFLYASQ